MVCDITRITTTEPFIFVCKGDYFRDFFKNNSHIILVSYPEMLIKHIINIYFLLLIYIQYKIKQYFQMFYHSNIKLGHHQNKSVSQCGICISCRIWFLDLKLSISLS